MNNISTKQTITAIGYYKKNISTKQPRAIIASYKQEIATKSPIIVLGYIPPILPITETLTIRRQDDLIIANAKLTDIGLGEISKCGFIVKTFQQEYIADGFEDGTLNGYTVSSTNSSLNAEKLVIIDKTTTSSDKSIYAAQLCSSGNSQTTKIACTVHGPKKFTFKWKVSSEKNYDTLKWYLNGELQKTISGEVDWQEETVTITTGEHIIEFTYSKDGSRDAGSDCGWIDDITHGMEPPKEYLSNHIPTQANEMFSAQIRTTANKSYIAAFVINQAGKYVSDYIIFENDNAWKGGAIYGIDPTSIEGVIIGDRIINRVMIAKIIVGKILI